MRINIKKSLVVSTILSGALNLLLPLTALAGTWDSTPNITYYDFYQNIGTTYINNVVVKTGYYDNGIPNTELTISFVPANCSAYTETNFTATLSDDYDGIPLTLKGSKTTYYGDTVELILTKDIMTVDPGYLHLNIINECTGGTPTVESTIETIEDSVEFDSTSKCDSHWLDDDCWGW